MSKWINRDTRDGRFVVGRRSAESISAVEGLRHTPRTVRVISDGDRSGAKGDAVRSRIRTEFKK